MKRKNLPIYVTYLLRHHPEDIGLEMDSEGFVCVEELIDKINMAGSYEISARMLDRIVQTDEKGRFCYSEDGKKIRACQGHSVPWVKPHLSIGPPPEFLYHGTTEAALQQIRESGAIEKMERHAVHMQADERKAWLSALRWRNEEAVVLKIDAKAMSGDGYTFGMADNGIWCTEHVPFQYVEVLTKDSWAGH